jgi:hypothetical protein
MNWQQNIVDSDTAVASLLKSTKRIAILGIKTEQESRKPAFYVAEYLAAAGYDIVPVPVYYPDVRIILGRPVYRTLTAIPGDIDMVDVFRRSFDIPPHIDDIIAKRPRSVWFQLGIRNDEAAEKLARSGIIVVQDRCTMAEHQRLLRFPSA